MVKIKMTKKMKNKGFTLMELMIVIAIIAILAAVVIPNFIGWIPERRVAVAAQDILQGLQKSRSKAIMTNSRVVFDLGVNAENFIAYVDEDASGGQDPGELTIVNRDMPAGIDLSANLAGAVTSITFDNQGIPDTSGTIRVQNTGGTTQNILLYLSGHSVLP